MVMRVKPPPEQLYGHEKPLLILGLNAAQIACVRGHLAHYVLMFKAYGLLISCMAFGWFVYGFAHGLLRWGGAESALLGLGAAPLLLLIESYNLATTIGVPGLHLQRWVARVVVVIFVFGGVLGQAADRLKDDVDATVATNVLARVEALKSSPHIKTDLTTAQNELKRTTDNVDALTKLQADKRTSDANLAQALAEQKMECDGAISKDGRSRVAGCGAKADGWAAEADRLRSESLSMGALIQAMGDPNQIKNAKATAQDRLDILNQQIQTQAERENGGSGARIAALLQAAHQDWGVVFVLAFTLGIYMLPDLIAWLALGHAPGGRNGPEGTFAQLKDVDRKQTERALEAFEHRSLHEINDDLPELEVKLPSAHQPEAAAQPATAPVAGWHQDQDAAQPNGLADDQAGNPHPAVPEVAPDVSARPQRHHEKRPQKEAA